MEIINAFTSTVEDLRDGLKGFYGKKYSDSYKIVYLGNLVIAEGSEEQIRANLECKLTDLRNVGNNVFIGFIE